MTEDVVVGPQHVWKMFGFYVIKRYEMRKLHMSSKQTCICLTFDPLSLHKVWKWLWFCEKEATINYHHGSAAKFRNTCRRSLTQRLVRWSSPVVPKVRVETRTRVAKGQKLGRAQVIQTGVVCFQRHHCLSVCSLDTWEKSRLLTLRTNLATYCQNHSHNHYFFIRCLRRVHQTERILGTVDLAILA